MAAGEHVALQPALAVVLGEHLHDPAVGRVPGVDLGVERPLPGVVGGLEHRAEPVGGHLVGAHDAEVALVLVEAEDVGVATRRAASARCRSSRPGSETSSACLSRSGSFSSLRSLPPLTCGFAPIRRSPVGQRVEDLLDRAAVLVEQLLRAVGAQPVLEDLQVPGVGLRLHRRHLVGLRRALDLDAVDLLRARSSPWATCSTIIGQRGRSGRLAAAAHALLQLADLAVGGVERLGQLGVEVRRPRTISGCQP